MSDAGNLLFLDFEASSLSRESWPIEIGVAGIAEGEVWSQSRLIWPHEDWPMDAWWPRSEEVHGISLDDLFEFGDPVAEVAGWFKEMGDGKSLISDNPAYDRRWLRRLLHAADISDVPLVVDYQHLLHASMDNWSIAVTRTRLRDVAAPHRAGPDAARLAAAFWAGYRLQIGQ